MEYTIYMFTALVIFFSVFFSTYFWQVFIPFLQKKYDNWRYHLRITSHEALFKARRGDTWAIAALLKGTEAWTKPTLSDKIGLYADRLAAWIEKKRRIRI